MMDVHNALPIQYEKYMWRYNKLFKISNLMHYNIGKILITALGYTFLK